MVGVGRIYSIQGGGGQKGGGGGRDIFKIQGELKKIRGVWTLDDAMSHWELPALPLLFGAEKVYCSRDESLLCSSNGRVVFRLGAARQEACAKPLAIALVEIRDNESHIIKMGDRTCTPIKYNQNKICCAIIKSTQSISAALDVP